ncbi:hypothetical protein [Ascidiimonas aurantiaca]|uniref:hypothetical protein n=1 Tax=Ascidiimonas aurantiaca TaxID=1685432 RepID=UPI0030EEEEA5
MATDSNKGYIEKSERDSGKYEDMYLEGVQILQQLSGAIWTDYNEHDPGVTILENLAYTLTDLAYKTDTPIQDILTESKGSHLQSGDNGFFIPSVILTTNPVTITDLRKIFIDEIENVKNVWIRPQNAPSSADASKNPQSNLKGLYHIYVELHDYSSNKVDLKQEENRIVNEVKELYHAHRNLCEDIYDVTLLEQFKLYLHLNLTLDVEANGEEVFANIFYKINDYLSHDPKFFSLWELKAAHEDVDAIFNGPLLKNGFIKSTHLKKRLRFIVPSDLVKLIARIEGVVSVDKFQLAYHDTLDPEEGRLKFIQQEKIAIPENCTPSLEFPKTNKNLVFENNGIRFFPDLEEVEKKLSYMEAMNYGNFRSVSQSVNEIEIPKGKFMDLASYYSIQNQFPRVYGIGAFGLQKGLPAKRYAQANQLKAYLLPFDQLMTNFLAQLTHVYNLYDVNDDTVQSYFSQTLNDINGLAELIKENEDEDQKEALEQWERTLNDLNALFDNNAVKRLNDVADNLLARFSEQFSTYALRKINTNCYGKKLTDELFEHKLLSWKRKLVANYAQLSYNRAKAYDYTRMVKITRDNKIEDKENRLIPGLIQKIAILTGIREVMIRSLTDIVEKSGIKIYQRKGGLDSISEKLEVVYAKDKDQIIAPDDIVIIDENVDNLRNSFYFMGNTGTILKDVLREGVLEENYHIKSTAGNINKAYYVLFQTKGEKASIVHIANTNEEAKQAVAYCINFLVELNEATEGIYMIEHILLAPPYHGNFFGFSFCLSYGENKTITFEQAYLSSNYERNIYVNEIVANLYRDGTLQLRPIKMGETYSIQIFDSKGEQLATSVERFDTVHDALGEIKEIVEKLRSFQQWQFDPEVVYTAYYGENKVEESFFSFQMSFILPAWPVRFQDDNFRTKFDNIVGEQAPVHIACESCWIDLEEMITFENVYFQWLEIIYSNTLTEEQMDLAYQLITLIQGYTSKTAN